MFLPQNWRFEALFATLQIYPRLIINTQSLFFHDWIFLRRLPRPNVCSFKEEALGKFERLLHTLLYISTQAHSVAPVAAVARHQHS
jgi:hypothetical protein